jgi:hypothetical protein
LAVGLKPEKRTIFSALFLKLNGDPKRTRTFDPMVKSLDNKITRRLPESDFSFNLLGIF